MHPWIGLCLAGYGIPRFIVGSQSLCSRIEQRQGLKVACLEEIAYYNDGIGADQLRKQVQVLGKIVYGQYLSKPLSLAGNKEMIRRSPELIARQFGAERAESE